MTPKGRLRVTFLALKGKGPYVMSRTHRESVWDFEEYVDWLRSMPSLDGMWTAHGRNVPNDSDGEPGEYRYYVPDGFWDNDGTLHMELPELPDAIMVRLPDERDREVYSSRSWRYVREDESENAKLRELVRDLYEMAYPERPSAFEAAFADRMHELGVEVD